MAQAKTDPQVDPKVIEDAGNEVISDLRALGLQEENIEEMQRRIVQDIVDKVILEMSRAFTDEDERRLKDAAATGLNQMQKITLVAELFKKKTGKRPEMLVEEFKDDAIIEVIRQYILTVLSGNAVTQISDQNCEILEKLIDEEKWLEAFKVMNTALKKGTGTPGIEEQSGKQPQESIQNTADALPHPSVPDTLPNKPPTSPEPKV